MNIAIIFCFLAFVIGASQADAGGKYCRMKWKCHNVLVHKCSWRIQNVCRNNCRRVKTKVAEHVAARLGVAGALHLHRGLQSVHVGAVRGQGLGRKVMLHGENGKDHHHWKHHGHHHWGHHGHHHWGHHGHHHWGHHGHHHWGKYDPGHKGPVTTAKNQLCVKVCHKEPRKSCWDAKELRCRRTGKKICHTY